jgi:quercetin dioxygenase-like cupin family protein
MRLVRISDLDEVAMPQAEAVPGWTGEPVSRSRQTILGAGDSSDYSCSVFGFAPGATTGWHSHDCDQILIVTAGTGFIANERGEHEMTVGDVVHIPAGEYHAHGTTADTGMSHIAITTVGSTSVMARIADR